MKNLFIATLQNLTSNTSKASINFSNTGFSRQELAAVKGGDDIVIRDIIGSNQGG